MVSTALMNLVSATCTCFTYSIHLHLLTFCHVMIIMPCSAKFFGLKRSPSPFLYLLTLGSHHFKKHVFRGVNFASAGAGVLDKTNFNMVKMYEDSVIILPIFPFHASLCCVAYVNRLLCPYRSR